jgi:hypothetical protein
MLNVRKPMFGVAVQAEVAPPLTGLVQFSEPFAPGLAVTTYCRGAVHDAVVPVFSPAQLQLNCVTELVTADAVPLEHRLAVGATSAATPSAEPQTPLTGTTSVMLCVT